jgi:hypothetical protein
MTEREFDRIARAWLDQMPTEAPDRAIESVLDAVQRTSQVRRPVFGLPWRSPMNRLSLIAATALLLTALGGGVWLLGSGQPGPTTPTPSPSRAATEPSAAATPRTAIQAPSQTIWGDWIAEVPALPEISNPAGLIQLSIDWENGDEVWLQTTPDYRQLLSSAPLPAAEGELRLRSNASNSYCTLDAEGRYRWTRSADAMFLDLQLIEDACQTRATVLARTWVRSHGAVSDGGAGVAYSTTPMTQLTLPSGQRYGANAGPDWQEMITFGDAEPFRAFLVMKNPAGLAAPCTDGDEQPFRLAATRDAFVTHVGRLPRASTTERAVTVGGRPATHLEVSLPSTSACDRPDGLAAFLPEDLNTDNIWSLTPGETASMYIVEMDAETTFLLWYYGPPEEEAAVIDSVRFVDSLPTP